MQKENHLQAGKDIQVWSFRVNGDLKFGTGESPLSCRYKSCSQSPRNTAVVSSPDQPEDGNED